MAYKSPLKGAWSRSCYHIKFSALNDISGTAKARVVKFCTSSPSLEGCGQGHVARV